MVAITLTVFFELPYWVAVFERIESGKLSVFKQVFGAEPKDYKIFEFILSNYSSFKFSNPIPIEKRVLPKINPKRMQREISKELKSDGLSTKSQAALKMQYEESKIAGKKMRKVMLEEKSQRKFELRQQKKKEKRKGH